MEVIRGTVRPPRPYNYSPHRMRYTISRLPPPPSPAPCYCLSCAPCVWRAQPSPCKQPRGWPRRADGSVSGGRRRARHGCATSVTMTVVPAVGRPEPLPAAEGRPSTGGGVVYKVGRKEEQSVGGGWRGGPMAGMRGNWARSLPTAVPAVRSTGGNLSLQGSTPLPSVSTAGPPPPPPLRRMRLLRRGYASRPRGGSDWPRRRAPSPSEVRENLMNPVFPRPGKIDSLGFS